MNNQAMNVDVCWVFFIGAKYSHIECVKEANCDNVNNILKPIAKFECDNKFYF